VGEDLPAAFAAAGVDRHHDALSPELGGDLADQLGPLHGRGVDRHLVGTGPQEAASVVDRADPAADGEGDEDLLGGAGGHLDHRVAGVGGGDDVEEDHLVGALGVVPSRQLDRVAGVAQAHEFDPLHHPTVADVEARDHPGRLHEAGARAANASTTLKRPS
jgi:hypothetical protein